MGPIGVGKSTFISNMLGLLDRDPAWLTRVHRLPGPQMLDSFQQCPESVQYCTTISGQGLACPVKVTLQVTCLSLGCICNIVQVAYHAC